MNAKQEILDALVNIRKAEMPQGLLPTTGIELDRIRAILETYELVRIYSQPFDPTLCGFERVEDSAGAWSNGEYVIYHLHGRSLIEEIAGAGQMGFPWPATQSDGETLLRLLGVLG